MYLYIKLISIILNSKYYYIIMNFEQKYLKYKNKYITLKNQIGGNFYFTVYVFSKNTLRLKQIKMIHILEVIFGMRLLDT